MGFCIIQRLKSMLGRGTLVMSDDKPKMRTLQCEFLKGEVREGLEHFEPYGWTSKAKAGAECLGFFFNGNRSHGVVAVTADRRYRLHVLEGEVAVFDDQGQRVYLKRDGIEINTPKNLTATVGGEMAATVGGNVTLKAPQTLIESNVQISGTLKVSEQITGTGGLAISGGSGASVSGSLAVSGGDVTADGISLKGHTHDCPHGGATGPAK